MNKVTPKEVYSYLLEKGVSHIHALGILANIKGESNFDAGVQERGVRRGRGGYGLFQHTGSRRRELENYCLMLGKPINDWKVQVDFAFREYESKKYLKKDFSDAESATAWWVRYWERPADIDGNIKRRVAYLPTIESEIYAT
jgi:hypothetical protein